MVEKLCDYLFKKTFNTWLLYLCLYSHISEDQACSATFRQRPGQQLQLLCDSVHRRSWDTVSHSDRFVRQRPAGVLRSAHEELHEPPTTPQQIRLQEVLWEEGVKDSFCFPDWHVQDTSSKHCSYIYLWIWWRTICVYFLNGILYDCVAARCVMSHFISRFDIQLMDGVVKNENHVIIYSPSCCSKPIWLFLSWNIMHLAALLSKARYKEEQKKWYL